MKKQSVKKRIEALFLAQKPGKSLYFSDIAKALDLDLEEVVRNCKQLVKDGKIHVALGKS